MVPNKTAQTMLMVASIFPALCKDSEDGKAYNSVMTDDYDALARFLGTSFAVLIHLPGQCLVKLY